jgi:O-antigen/teichoic acid export membrane protein
VRDRLIRGAGVAALGFLMSRVITLGAYVVIASLLDPSDVGEFAAGALFAGIGVLFAESGMLAAVIQWRGDNVDEVASTAFAATFTSGLLLTCIAAAAAPLIGLFFDSDTVRDIALVLSATLFLRGLTVVPDALLQRRFSFVRRVVIDPLGAIAFASVAIVACASGMGPWGLVLGTYALHLVQVVSAWLFVRWRPRLSQMSFAVWRKLAGFGRHVVASEMVRQTTLQFDTLLLGRFAGAATLGQYTYGLRLAGQPVGAFVSVAAYILLPAFARVAEDLPRLRAAVVESLMTSMAVMLPVSLMLVPLGDQLALLAFGPEWAGAGDAIKALFLIGVGLLWGSIASEVVKATDNPRVLTRMHLISLVSTVILMSALLPLDEVGIGLATSLTAMIAGTWGLWKAGQEIGTTLTALLRPMGVLLLASVVATGIAGILDATVFADANGRGGAAVAIAVEGATALCVYCGSLLLLAPEFSAQFIDALGRLRPGRGSAVPA